MTHEAWMASTTLGLCFVISKLASTRHIDEEVLLHSTYRAVIHHHERFSGEVMMILVNKSEVAHA